LAVKKRIKPKFLHIKITLKFRIKIYLMRDWKKKFLKALKEDPEFAAEARALLLSEDLLNLPPKFDRLEKKVDRIEERVDRIEKRVDKIEQRVDRIEERLDGIEERVSRIEEDVSKLKDDVGKLTNRVDRLEKDVAYLKGSDRERWYRDRAHAIFGRVILKGRPFEEKAAEILWEACKKGQISKEERDEVLSADLLWSGEREGEFVVLVVEVSFTISQDDVERAKKRAEILRKLGILAIPVVGGVEIGKDVKRDDVVCIVDGKFSDEEFEKLFAELHWLK
jgi:predicted nuclease with TOPRIM domain